MVSRINIIYQDIIIKTIERAKVIDKDNLEEYKKHQLKTILHMIEIDVLFHNFKPTELPEHIKIGNKNA